MLPSFPRFGYGLSPVPEHDFHSNYSDDENVESDVMESDEDEEEVLLDETGGRVEGGVLQIGPSQNIASKRSRDSSPDAPENNASDDDDDDDDESFSVENDEYLNFVRSIFCDDAASEKSGTDADEDEDYNPDADPTGKYPQHIAQ